MNSLKNFILSAVALTGVGGAYAQSLGEGMVINPYPASKYQTFLTNVLLAYDFKIITIADEDLAVNVTINDKLYDVYPEVYFDPEIAWELGQTNSNPAWGNELVIDFSEEAYADSYPVGTYTIEIPEGLVKDENGNVNPEQIITFVKVDPVKPVYITPPDGTYPSQQLKNVEITFSEEIALNPERGKITAREKNDWINPPAVIDSYSIAEDGKTLKLDLSEIELGIVSSINIPEKFLLVGDDYVNEEIWLEYMNWNGLKPATIISAPEPESTPDLKPFVLTWDYQPISITHDAPDTEFVCGFPDFGWQEGWRVMIPADYYTLVYVAEGSDSWEQPSDSNPANAVYLDVKDLIDDFNFSRFEIIFPIGLVENNEGLTNPSQNYVFNVSVRQESVSISAEDGVINIIWPQADWVTYNLSDDDPVLINASGETIPLEFTFGGTVPGQVSLINSDIHGIEVNLNEMDLSDGYYTLFIPDSYVVITDIDDNFNFNAPLSYEFAWKDGNFDEAGAPTVKPDSDIYHVFSINGQKIMESSDMTSLRNGIYIINGKKIIIKSNY